VLGAVLAGGRSSRMGVDKAAIEVDGVTMFDRVVAALRHAGCSPVVSVGGRSRPSVDHVADLHPQEGPLGGIVTALAHAGELEAEAVVVVACDMPSLSGRTISQLVEAHRSGGGRVVAGEGERVEPMCALWPVAIATEVNDMFESGERSVARVLDRLVPIVVPVGASVLANINTPEELRRLTDVAVDTADVDRPSGSRGLR